MEKKTTLTPMETYPITYYRLVDERTDRVTVEFNNHFISLPINSSDPQIIITHLYMLTQQLQYSLPLLSSRIMRNEEDKETKRLLGIHEP